MSNPNISLGDWNDDLKDADREHCFDLYLDDSNFLFQLWILRMMLQGIISKEICKFLDHIMITSDFHEGKSSSMDLYMILKYEAYISDHMPVYLSFPFKIS